MKFPRTGDGVTGGCFQSPKERILPGTAAPLCPGEGRLGDRGGGQVKVTQGGGKI